MSETALETIKRQISENPILLYMKGSPQAPQCGFSAKTIECMVDGELVGGCDIVTEMFESGELEALLSETTERHTDSEDS